MASSSSKGGGGGSPANSSSSIYPASFIKRNLVPGADSYRQTLAALRDMDKGRGAGGLGRLGGEWVSCLSRERGSSEGKEGGLPAGVMGPDYRKDTPPRPAQALQGGVLF